ncbi:MAG: DEAD/DEAH box helicase, partial [Solirubrobacteraceae bacterium]
VWRRVGELVEAHVQWLRLQRDDDPAVGAGLRALAAMLAPDGRSAAHPDLHHLALLIAEACDDTWARALRRVPSPPGDDGRFADYQRARAARRPLLWPATERYVERVLLGSAGHAVVTVPTGAGKSSVAEMAAAQALHDGWVLYLAPTNALVAQIRRDLAATFHDLGVAVVGLTGGAEFSIIEGDTLRIADRQIAVMTPEKCSLALRQSPELFASLRLCVMDEAHLIGEAQSRGVVAELVLAEVLHRAPDVRVLLLSALVESPDDLARWLEDVTGVEAVGIDEPWRPTRTLRALCGVADEELQDAEAGALAEFAGLAARRRAVKVDVPLRLLGALHGAWSGEDRGDYAIVDTGVTAKGQVARDGQLQRTGHTAPVTRALTDHLAAAGHRLLVFLPADRHAPFAHARQMDGPGPGVPVPEVESLLTLADAEIAGPRGGHVTAVRDALAKGVSIHSSAMVAEEQRACEIAFERGAATVMLATGTLAQGLNLPATAVVIGGTHVGDARDAQTAEGRARTKSQLLNAIGRAGRAQTAARSIAIVVPSSPVRVALVPDVATARRAAPWLADEDGSAQVSSQLGGLIADALAGRVDLATMEMPEQTAFAFLSFTAESGDAAAVLARTLAAHRADASRRAEQLTQTLRDLGGEYLRRNASPAWIATAAHRAGVALPAAAALERHLRRLLEARAEPPDTLALWAQIIAWLLVQLPLEERRMLLGDPVIAGMPLANFGEEDLAVRTRAGRVLSETLRSWLAGDPLVEVGRVLHAVETHIPITRGKGHQLPRTLRFVRDGIEHALTTVAGTMLAIVLTGAEKEPGGPWSLPAGPMGELAMLPVALRYGAANAGALALLQVGLRPRVVAHLAARVAPPPEAAADEEIVLWAWETVRRLETLEFIDTVEDPAERATLRAAAHVRSAV